MEVQLTPELQSKLSRMAAQQGRQDATLVAEAVERFVDHDAWFRSEVQTGLDQISEGRTLSHEEVGKRLNAYLAEQHQPA